MGDFLIGLSIPIGILILLVLLRITLIKLFKKKSTPNIQQKGSSTQSESASGATPPPADHANHTHTAKSKTNWLSKILWTIFVLVATVAVLVFLAWALPFIKKAAIEFLEPSPQYRMVLVYDRTVSVNLDSDWSDANTVLLEEGEKCTFKEATVSFCVKNLGNETVCGQPNTDPNLPNDNGDFNQKLWFKSEYGESGTIKVDIFKRKRQQIN